MECICHLYRCERDIGEGEVDRVAVGVCLYSGFVNVGEPVGRRPPCDVVPLVRGLSRFRLPEGVLRVEISSDNAIR